MPDHFGESRASRFCRKCRRYWLMVPEICLVDRVGPTRRKFSASDVGLASLGMCAQVVRLFTSFATPTPCQAKASTVRAKA